jgi:monothiol glutaredoxin
MSDTQTRIDQIVKSSDVVLFMKGNANFPQCGFSGKAIAVLKACGVTKPLTVNVLEDGDIRNGIKEYSCRLRAGKKTNGKASGRSPHRRLR